MFHKQAYIVNMARLPVGKHNGWFKNTIPEDFTSYLLQSILAKNPLYAQANELVMGCALGTGGNMARYVALQAGLPQSIAATTVDLQCASGVKAIAMGVDAIKNGQNLILAGGMESVSLAPIRVYTQGDRRTNNNFESYHTAQFAPEEYNGNSVTQAAKNVAELYKIPKLYMMDWHEESHQKYNVAYKKGIFNEIIEPYLGKNIDQNVKSNLTLAHLEKAQTSEIIDFTTAAHKHDGAAILALASEFFCKANNLQPIAKIVDYVQAGLAPSLAPMGVVTATEALLVKNNININTIDLFEINESFAVNPLVFLHYFKVDPQKVNIFGGNLAWGHPFGASGTINTMHLAVAMKSTNAQRGLVTVAAAGGQAMALLLEKV